MNSSHPTEDNDLTALSYEQAREELSAVVEALETQDNNLEQSLALWEKGQVLAQVCERWLTQASERIASVKARLEESTPPG